MVSATMRAARTFNKKQKENDADQNHALGQIVHDGVEREMEKIAAVQHGNDLHTGGQEAVVELVDFIVNGVERGLFFGAFAHQHRALNYVGLVDDAPVLHVIGSCHVAQADFGALSNFSDVFHPQGGAGLGFEDSLLDVAHAGEQAESADIHLLHPDLYKAAAGIDVVVGELLLHLADAQSVGDELVGIDAHLVLADRAAEVGNIHHVGNGLELLEQNPVFERPEVPSGHSADSCFAACTSRSVRWCSSRYRSAAGGFARAEGSPALTSRVLSAGSSR